VDWLERCACCWLLSPEESPLSYALVVVVVFVLITKSCRIEMI
jgi:hypothetical protein